MDVVKNMIGTKRKKWIVHTVFDDFLDAKNSADDFKEQGQKAKIENTGTGYAVYYQE